MSRLVLIDTDMLADDALAILLAAASPELEIGAVTCIVGRDSVDVVAHNTLRVLHLAGATGVPVASGASKPLMYKAGTGKILGQKSPWNRLSGAMEKLMPAAARGIEKQHGVDLMLSLVDRNAGNVDLVTLGPLTNIALCLAMDDHFAEKVSRVVMMAGAVFVPGNSAPRAETNVYADPEAARIVFQSGLPITLVGLDVTTKVLMRSPQARSIRTSRNTGVGEFISAIINSSLEAQRAIRKWDGFPMHDPLAIGVAIDPSFVCTRRMFVDVEVRGELTAGATVGDSRDVWGRVPNVDVCVDVEADRFLDYYAERLSSFY